MNLFDAIEQLPPVTHLPSTSDTPTEPVYTKDELIETIARVRREITKKIHYKDPNAWVAGRLDEQVWSAQKRILAAVAKYRRVAVKSCHEIGKSFIASRVVAWWLERDQTGDAFVVTSAPTGQQVKAILWREIQRAHTKGNLRGRVNQASWFMKTEGGKEELVAFGRKPDDYDPTAFQGIHAPRVLVVFDEACGMPPTLWEAADSLIANDQSKTVVFGNPDDPESHFAEICKPGSGWHVIEIGAFDTPNFTGEQLPEKVLQQLIGRIYVEEKRRKWAPRWFWVDRDGKPCDVEHGVRCVPPDGADPSDTNPYWQSKILGKFPARSVQGGLIPYAWIEAARQRTLVPKELDPRTVGVDVGAGGDSSVISFRHGPVFRILSEDKNPNTMETCGNVVAALESTGATKANVDDIGIGKGVVDRGKELLHPFVAVNVGRAALDTEHFVNLRAELYWNLRERFEQGQIDIDLEDEDLAAELVELRFKRLSTGKIQIESKDDMKRRGVPSPNRAESLMLAFTDLPEEEEWTFA